MSTNEFAKLVLTACHCHLAVCLHLKKLTIALELVKLQYSIRISSFTGNARNYTCGYIALQNFRQILDKLDILCLPLC